MKTPMSESNTEIASVFKIEHMFFCEFSENSRKRILPEDQ